MAESSEAVGQIDWRLTTFDGSRREQLRRWAALPLERTILAIEEMEELAGEFGVTRENTPPRLPACTPLHLETLDPTALVQVLIENEDRASRDLIDECVRRGEGMVERLAFLLEDDRHWNGEETQGERWLLLHAVMILGLVPGERAGLLLVSFMRRMAVEDDDNLRERHRDLLNDLAARQRRPDVIFAPQNVEDAFAGRDPVPDRSPFDDPWSFYTPEQIAERQERWAREETEADLLADEEWGEDQDEERDSDWDEPGETYARPAPKVGRNDPCPCGSGKKYKKCCLAKDQA